MKSAATLLEQGEEREFGTQLVTGDVYQYTRNIHTHKTKETE